MIFGDQEEVEMNLTISFLNILGQQSQSQYIFIFIFTFIFLLQNIVLCK